MNSGAESFHSDTDSRFSLECQLMSITDLVTKPSNSIIILVTTVKALRGILGFKGQIAEMRD